MIDIFCSEWYGELAVRLLGLVIIFGLGFSAGVCWRYRKKKPI